MVSIIFLQLIRMVLDDVDANGRVDVVFTDSVSVVWLVNTAGTSGPRFTVVRAWPPPRFPSSSRAFDAVLAEI